MRPRRRFAWALTALLVAGSVGVAAIGWEAADRAVHPPRQASHATPERRGLDYEDVAFQTDDGWTLRGWWIPAPTAEEAPVVVFLHGYGASKAQALSVAPFLHRAGYAVLAFDFRAHGESDGAFTTLGLEETRDVRAAVEYVATREDADAWNVTLFGWSMGAAAALLAGPLPGVRAVVVDSAFAAADEVITRVLASRAPLLFAQLCIEFASWKVGRRASDARPADAARDLDLPLLIIQGLDDDVARASDAEAIHAAAKRSQIWLVPGAKHTGARLAEPAEYESRVLTFLLSARAA